MLKDIVVSHVSCICGINIKLKCINVTYLHNDVAMDLKIIKELKQLSAYPAGVSGSVQTSQQVRGGAKIVRKHSRPRVV
jgi:hypothetical protein